MALFINNRRTITVMVDDKFLLKLHGCFHIKNSKNTTAAILPIICNQY